MLYGYIRNESNLCVLVAYDLIGYLCTFFNSLNNYVLSSVTANLTVTYKAAPMIEKLI